MYSQAPLFKVGRSERNAGANGRVSKVVHRLEEALEEDVQLAELYFTSFWLQLMSIIFSRQTDENKSAHKNEY